jgi:hypothetical protein
VSSFDKFAIWREIEVCFKEFNLDPILSKPYSYSLYDIGGWCGLSMISLPSLFLSLKYGINYLCRLLKLFSESFLLILWFISLKP